jgi:membrane-associated phospholipid phosphatase
MSNPNKKCAGAKHLFCGVLGFLFILFIGTANAASPSTKVYQAWYKFVLELVRHTPTYTPPVASRAFAYFSIAAFEATASGSTTLQSLTGQLQNMPSAPKRERGKTYDEAVVLQATMSTMVDTLFSNTGPTGQHAILTFTKTTEVSVQKGLSKDVVKRSAQYGQKIANNILLWSKSDGGSTVDAMGFGGTYKLNNGPAHWVPTNTIGLQQKPLLPLWGKNRSFAMPNGASCNLPPPPEYSEDKNSEFFKQAMEVVEVKNSLTAEQKAIARFWSDDAMLSVTPPGHWVSIALQILEKQNAEIDQTADVLARLTIAEADAFIGCWNAKFKYDLLRPLTYIRRVIDPKWESFINTPPFPEYPSGHSTQSGAAALVLTQAFGENFAFTDETGSKDGLKPRTFKSFAAAAEEAGISRLYGGIHYRAAIENGLVQGRCIGTFATALKTRK